MKKSYSTLSLASVVLASVFLASCSQEKEDVQLSSQEEPVYLQVEVEPLSRTTLVNDLPSECDYGIYCNSKTSKVNYVKGKSTILDPIQLDKTYQTVFAYYPYSDELQEFLNMEGGGYFSAQDGIDYLWGMSSKEVNCYYPQTVIDFHHVFSYISFVIEPNPYLAESLKEDLIVDYVGIGEIPIECLVDGRGVLSVSNEEFINLYNNGQSLASGPIKMGTLCAPFTSKNIISPVIICIYFKGYEDPAVVKIPNEIWNMEAGKMYTHYITVNGRLEAELSEKIYVRPWNESESQDFIVN